MSEYYGGHSREQLVAMMEQINKEVKEVFKKEEAARAEYKSAVEELRTLQAQTRRVTDQAFDRLTDSVDSKSVAALQERVVRLDLVCNQLYDEWCKLTGERTMLYRQLNGLGVASSSAVKPPEGSVPTSVAAPRLADSLLAPPENRETVPLRTLESPPRLGPSGDPMEAHDIFGSADGATIIEGVHRPSRDWGVVFRDKGAISVNSLNPDYFGYRRNAVENPKSDKAVEGGLDTFSRTDSPMFIYGTSVDGRVVTVCSTIGGRIVRADHEGLPDDDPKKYDSRCPHAVDHAISTKQENFFAGSKEYGRAVLRYLLTPGRFAMEEWHENKIQTTNREVPLMPENEIPNFGDYLLGQYGKARAGELANLLFAFYYVNENNLEARWDKPWQDFRYKVNVSLDNHKLNVATADMFGVYELLSPILGPNLSFCTSADTDYLMHSRAQVFARPPIAVCSKARTITVSPRTSRPMEHRGSGSFFYDLGSKNYGYTHEITRFADYFRRTPEKPPQYKEFMNQFIKYLPKEWNISARDLTG